MKLMLDTPINIGDDIYYIIVSQHRVPTNRHKSYWIINCTGELESFQLTILEKWYQPYKGWGVYLSGDGNMNELGRNSFDEILKIAKFIDSTKNNQWHGYPADYRRKVQDRPPTEILVKWRNEGIIEKHCISKIRAGKVCNL
jgi:hypothetical protein